MLPHRPVVGPFDAERLLGLGADGAVWRAIGPGGPVALKVAVHARQRPRLEAEAERLRACEHPHLARLVNAGEGWLVTELIDGMTFDRWARGRGSADILRVALELWGALDHLHQQGVFHGDLRPANVLVDSWGHPKLIDLAAPEDETRGVPGFIAPERLDGAPATVASETWSFAATVYAALTGRAPHTAGDPTGLAHLTRHASPVPPSAWRVDMPHRVDRLLCRMLLRDPAARPAPESVVRGLTRAWKDAPARPVLGMLRARRQLHAALSAAAAGTPTVVVVHGPIGSGRRTLLRELARQGRLEGMVQAKEASLGAFEAVRRAREIPMAVARASREAVTAARSLLEGDAPGLIALHGREPVPALEAVGALTVTPDALDPEDALQLAAWLGVADRDVVRAAWRQAQGHPQAVWLALEPHASRHLDDRAPFTLPGSVRRIIQAVRANHGVMPLDRVAHAVGLSLPEVSEHCTLLEATGRFRLDGDGWILREEEGRDE